ncbi:hypothetical protein [Nitrosomonas communis]|uniref:Uncharacterized protein n=1 Tax=Nitrosomonas communis TaxID=44574 RepID=A0A1I4XGX6_9PROT|nr:hypothetical protein [Nitrosomonas communis]SFN25161.1 hypothetical protein SAMN05421863_11573 [Nitrosomonas communis]
MGISDAFYYTIEKGQIAAKIKGDPIVEQEGQFNYGSLLADDFIIKRAGHFTIEDFHNDQGDQLVFDTGYGLVSREQLISFVTDMRFEGDDFIVNFGDSASITLVGVHQGQISFDDVVVLS